MNGVRSISMRKGYLLTALAAAVLLAASSGTAYAQGIGFVGTSRTMMEGASPDSKTPAPITIDINVTGLTTPAEGVTGNLEDGLGEVTLVHNADDVYPGQDARDGDMRRIWLDSKSSAIDEAELAGNNNLTAHTVAAHAHLYGVADGAVINYDSNGVIKLVIIDPGGDGNWADNSFTMDLRTQQVGVSPSPGSFKVTVRDTSPQPTVSFSRTSVSLTEGSQTTTGNPVNVEIGVPPKMTAPTGMASLTNVIQFTTSPAGAAVVGECVAGDDDVIALDLGSSIEEVQDEEDTYMVGAAGQIGSTPGNHSIGIEACGDMSSYNDEMVTFSFVATTLTGEPMGYGSVAAGPNLVVTVQSEGEAVPTVSFATTSIDIAEGGTNTVAILADGTLGAEVGSVMVSVSGDAMLSLWQDGSMIESGAGGMYEVMLGTADEPSANTILTISADSDRALEDGMTSSATLTIESANGATIGGRDSLTVTVMGSTAVAALPLLAQLLLALFLMAGGARLYRRRNG